MKLAINSRNVCQSRGFNPWEQLENEVSRLFGTPWAVWPGEVAGSPAAAFVPALEVRENADGYTVAVDLPGLRKEDVQVSYEDGILAITGERKAESTEAAYLRRERRYGRFERRLELPAEVQADGIGATFKDGVLTITLPKVPAAKARQVEIRAE